MVFKYGIENKSILGVCEMDLIVKLLVVTLNNLFNIRNSYNSACFNLIFIKNPLKKPIICNLFKY